MIKYVLKQKYDFNLSQLKKYPDFISIVLNDIFLRPLRCFVTVVTAFRRDFCSLCKNSEKR